MRRIHNNLFPNLWVQRSQQKPSDSNHKKTTPEKFLFLVGIIAAYQFYQYLSTSPKNPQESFSVTQKKLYDALQSDSSLKITITPEKIATLKIHQETDVDKLMAVLNHFLLTQKKSWEETADIINGKDIKIYTLGSFLGSSYHVTNFKINPCYINNTLHSQIFRDKAQAEFNYKFHNPQLYLTNERDMNALRVLIKNRGMDPESAYKKLIQLRLEFRCSNTCNPEFEDVASIYRGQCVENNSTVLRR